MPDAPAQPGPPEHRAGSGELIPPETYAAVEAGDEFRELRRRFRAFAFPMTALFLAWYLLYVVASGWGRGFLDNKLLGEINVAYVFGLLQFVSTFLITWIYWRHADRSLDPLAGRIRGELEEVEERIQHGGRGFGPGGARGTTR